MSIVHLQIITIFRINNHRIEICTYSAKRPTHKTFPLLCLRSEVVPLHPISGPNLICALDLIFALKLISVFDLICGLELICALNLCNLSGLCTRTDLLQWIQLK